MARQQSGANSLWIYGPALDLIVGCGAWSAPLLLISYASISSSARAWSIAFYVLALFFNYPHYMATIYRAYHRAEDFHKYRIFTVHTTALVLLTLVLSHSWPRILPWIFTLYLTWSPWHYSGQNYGLFMMFARRAGAQPSVLERRALYGAFVFSYLILFLGFHSGPSADPLFISLGIPAVIGRWEQAILCLAFVGLSGFGLSRIARTTGWRKLTPALTLFSSQVLWFLVPAAISLVKGLDVPQSRYSTGVLAVMHSAQYLWITSYYAKREATGEASGDTVRKWRGLAYFGVLVVGGIALFVPGPWLASRVFHHDFSVSFLIFTALVNIHHFILDGAIWKLRDGRIASLLLNSREQIAGAAAEAGGKLARAWQWLTGQSSSAHYVRVGAALALLAWGTLDQARYYLALHAENAYDLQRAASLNGYDSGLQTRLAQRDIDDGFPQQAEAAWKKAIQSNPADPAPRQAFLRFLIDRNRYDEAFDLTEGSLKYAPKDVNLLVNRGFLALQRGQAGQAVANWEQAIAIDPGQILAHLYLADELDREGKAQPAAAHYGAFLERIAKQPAQSRPAPDKVIAVALRMADCQARASQTDQAVKSYRLAQKLAIQTKQPKLESVAEINEAALHAQAGRVDDALRLYQQALTLDESIADNGSTAQDLFAYGHFLNEAGFSPRLVYACLVKAQRLVKSSGDARFLEALDRSKKAMEKQVGARAAAVERDPGPALQEALALRR